MKASVTPPAASARTRAISAFDFFTSSVSFSDGEGGEDTVFTDVAEGDVIQIPSPAQNDGAIFEGWYDSSSGQYLSPDETEYTVRGMGASFEALYIKAEATKMTTGHYDVDSVPTGVQIPLTFTLANSGSEDIQGVDITVSSDIGYARLMNTSAYLRTMRAGQDYSLRNVILVISSDCPAGTVIPLTVTMSDSGMVMMMSAGIRQSLMKRNSTRQANIAPT